MLKDLVKQSRSYRSFDPAVKITQEQLLEFADAARLTPSTTNLQAIKFKLVSDPAQVESLVERTTLAAALRPWVLPPKGHHPAAFIVVCIDTAIAKNPTPFLKDVGIAAQTILLCAAEQGLGGCMVGNFQPEAIREALGLGEEILPSLCICLGKPDETVVLEEMQDGKTAYYRDEAGVHHVPKRSLKEILL